MFLAPISHAVDVSYTTLATLTLCPVTPLIDHKKKPKRIRTSYTETQIKEFEKIFVNDHYPSRMLMDKLSNTLDIPVERIRTWFQNRRSRQKKVRQNKILQYPPTAANHQTDTIPMDMYPSINCPGGTTMAVHCGANEINRWLYADTTYTPTTNQACMNCDSRTVYSTLYHHPVMTPAVVGSPRSGQLDNYPGLLDRGSYVGNKPCYANQSMQLAKPNAMCYTFQQPISRPHSPQYGMNLPPHNLGNVDIAPSHVGSFSGQQVGGYGIDKSYRDNCIFRHVLNRNSQGAYNDPMYSVSASNGPSVFPDNNFNAMYNLLLNVGQLQLSSYHMQVNTNATLSEQTGGDMEDTVHQLGSHCQSVGGNPRVKPMFYDQMESQRVVHSTCYTSASHSTESLGSHSSGYPWQVTTSRDSRSWNYNRLLFSSQPSPVVSLHIPKEDNLNRCRKEIPNSRLNFGFKQHLRPEWETNLNFIQAGNNYACHSTRSTDDDTWSTINSQDSDTESLESFGGTQCIPQLDMTASLLPEFSPFGPMSPDSFRGDTPHPDL